MKTWLHKLTGLLCAAICIGNTADAGISNLPPPPKPQIIEVKKESSTSKKSSPATRKSSSSATKSKRTTHKSKSKSKNASIKKSTTKSQSTKQPLKSEMKSSNDSHSSNSLSSMHLPPAPDLTKAPLVIKQPRRSKKTKAKGKLQRGKRGRPGKNGMRGKKGKKGSKGEKGDKGDPGTNGITGFISAVSVGANSANTIAVGNTIKSFTVTNNSSITYDPSTGIFTSTAGPGHYEIHYGAAWNGQCAVCLRVDGNEVHPFVDLNTPASWARESTIIFSKESTPTFALGNAKSSATPMTLTNQGSYSSAFITIKKIG